MWPANRKELVMIGWTEAVSTGESECRMGLPLRESPGYTWPPVNEEEMTQAHQKREA